MKNTGQLSPARVQRILIVDDHPMMRLGFLELIRSEPDLTVSGEASDARQALELLTAGTPDLLIMDLSLPDRSGLDLLQEIHQHYPALPVLVLSMHEEGLYAERALRAGARGYVMKHEGPQKLLQSIRSVLEGKVCVSERISARILEGLSGKRPRPVGTGLDRLSDREFEVFRMIGQGIGTRAIATRLNLSVKTVEVHRANIKRKLGVRSAPELVRYAVCSVEVPNHPALQGPDRITSSETQPV